ncbi:FMN-dependent dehydrogenase-domain-containing protein [Hypoxylon rubiginosum]|uniref:FMN-dependent dehydrogenase-domain-containing protein n=1 Tax=Hypoxylon rubiginosum TaxID=110542 RepID=A0ACB9YSE6_9PEZI|nr:FMN-dependent dehydrogenase-domain-containing protein [Hypoxylon rubiginosum]
MGEGQNNKEPEPRLVGVDELSRHRLLHDLWLVIDGVVWDFSQFATEHPGGAAVIAQHAGRDATTTYNEVHSPNLVKTVLPAASRIGVLDRSTVTEEWAKPPPHVRGPPRKMTREAKPPLENLINARDFEVAAETSFTPKAWAFVSSAATDCLTKERNASTYREIVLRPRVLRNVSSVDISTTVLGQRIRAPIFCAPTSMGRIFHPEGERELGRGCQRLGVPQCVSTSCSFSLPEVMDAVEEEREILASDAAVPVFFQLYVDKDRRKSERLLRMVKERGVKAVFLTVDAPVIGKREADERVKSDESLKAPMSGASAKNDKKGGALGRLMGSYIDASMTWEDIAWLRRTVPGLPVVLKGIQTSMDAVKAMEVGVDAIYITNHGGRSLDTSPATILVLLELQKNCPRIFDEMEVYIDGGITRGTDIFKALCLGARAVGIGRGFLFALNYGKEGIEQFVNILTDELATTMQMCGITSLDQVHPGLLHTGAVDHLVPGSDEHPYAIWRPKPSKL